MTERIPQSTSYLLLFKAYLNTDGVTEATGKTIAITISKNGGAFGNPNAGATNATEISSGWYKVTLDTTDTGTLGPLAVRGAVATIDDVGILMDVVSATSGGATNLDATVSGRMATYTQPTGFLAATFPATVASTTNITAASGVTLTAAYDAAKTAATQASVNIIDDFLDTEIADIKAKTDNLPSDPADASDIASSFTTVNTKLDTIDDFLDTEVAAIKLQTDKLTFTVANQVDSNIQYVNDVQVTGNGETGTEWGPV